MFTLHARLKGTLALLLGAAVLAVSCGPKKSAQTPDASLYAGFVKAYTGGIVSEDATLRIDLTADATAMPTDGLFSLKPAVSGVTQWDSPTTVRFIPEAGALKPGQNYVASFALGKVMESAPEDFCFGFVIRGKAAGEELEKEPNNGKAFRVTESGIRSGHIDLVFSQAPANANLKGMIDLKGAARYYVQTQDSLVRVHFEGRQGKLELTLDPGLKSVNGESLGSAFEKVYEVKENKPAVEIPLSGNILPDKQQLILPFKAVNLSAVEVRVVKIYEKNVLLFLQDNDLGENSGIRRCGRLVWRGDVYLDPSKNLHEWNEHSIDLSKLIKQEPGAIYKIRLSFRQDQSLYGGKEPVMSTTAPTGKPSVEDDETWDIASSYYWDNDYDWEEYDWEDSDNPDTPSYYMDSDRFPSVQLMSSDIGLMAEYAGGKELWVVATDIISGKPVSGASLEVYDYQLQLIAKGKTDGKGLAELAVEHKPFAIVAKAGGSASYLKVTSGNERSTSRFDVGGEVLDRGMKAFLYGERGVWRPGDTIHLTMILSDRGKALPEGHPATLEVYTPEGQFYAKQVKAGTDGFFAFDIPTKADDPTGYWNAYVKVGGNSWYKTLHVETIKPNRFKITTSYPALMQTGESYPFGVQASWLAGGAAADAPARAEMTLSKLYGNPFKGFEKYTFNNPAANFSNSEWILYKTRLSGKGENSVNLKMPAANDAPGMLQAFIVTSVEEPGGDESFTTETVRYSPFSAYVGISIPDGDYLETDTQQRIKIAVVDAEGKRVKGHKLEYVLFKTGWNWWWDSPGGDLTAYVSGSSVEVAASGNLTSSGSDDTSFTFQVDYPDWGRFLVLVRDKDSGHVSGRSFIVDWPSYRGRANRGDPESLTMITLSTDKNAYQAGEKATVYIPAAPGDALVSIENASGVLQREWVKTSAQEDTKYTFTITPEMAPNVYVNVTLLQPYGSTVNDLPLRLYGVKRVLVENPDSHLVPVIQMPDVIHPEEEFTVKVSEQGGKPMTYTLAIVDEGLLDLTAYKTPNPWDVMYRPEALGVKTWDLYDQVIGAFSGQFAPLAAIGGDQENIQNARKDNRFNPVVLTLAPKTLQKGTDELKLKLPMYVGSVRVMLVAGHEGAFGNAEKTVPVQNPLMIVTTLPRVLGDSEEVKVPVNVFAIEDGINNANISIKVDGPVSIVGDARKGVSFSADKKDQLVSFDMKSSGEGIAHITVEAEGAGHKTSETIALEVRNPNPEVAQVTRFQLAKGASRSIAADGATTLQLAGFPAPDAKAMYLNMKNYTYDCTEQLAARGLTMLHMMPLLSKEDAEEARSLLPGIIAKIYGRQNADGGFSYWGGSASNTWVTSMAGLFLTEADKAKVEVDPGVLKKWKDYQGKMSQVYRIAGNSVFSHLDEAFRLYTLAVAGASSVAGMNRLKEAGDIGDRARWMLASAYALSGKGAQANAVLEGIGKEFEEYEPYNLTYGTRTRDWMVALDAMALTGKTQEALEMASEPLPSYMSTQETAFTAMAYHHLFEKLPTTQVKASVGGTSVSGEGIVTCPVEGTVTVKNESDGPVNGTVVSVSRTPRTKAVAQGLNVEVTYVDEDGKPVQPAKVAQGTRMKVTIKVTNTSSVRALQNLALKYAIPSGWEIVNDRMNGMGNQGYDHMDIRDDKALWYFALPAGRYKVFNIEVRAAYEGVYTLPSTVAEAMYEPQVNGCTAAGTATVVAR